MKDKHINHLRSKEIIETKTIQSHDQRQVQLTLVRDPDSRYQHFVIRDFRKANSGEPDVSYVRVANEILVGFKKKPSDREVKKFADDFAVTASEKLYTDKVYLFTHQDVSLDHIVALEEKIAKDPRVESIEGNHLYYPAKTPNDPMFRSLWGMQNNGTDPAQQMTFQANMDIEADLAWEDMVDCSTVPVAVLDTGIDPQHPDLQANVLADLGRDFTTNNQADFIDRQGHGTHVAGTIAAVGDNNIGVAGVCWKAAIIPIKVLGDDGFGTLQSIISGYNYAASTNAKVLNLSLGGAPPSTQESDAIAGVENQGKILVIAAGNENNNNDVNPAYPASYPNEAIISVAAIHGGGDLATFSNFGATTVDIAAPGQNILSTVPVALSQNNADQAYQPLSGTSMASPHVAGAVALFWAYAPELTAQQVKTELLATARQGTFTKQVAGSRLMDLAKLMQAVKPKVVLQGLEDGQAISVRNSNQYTFKLTSEEKYSKIAKIEIFFGEEMIASKEGAVQEITVQVPINASAVELTARVTDERGRVYTTSALDLTLDLEKILAYSEIDLESVAGDVNCELTKTQADGTSLVLFKKSLNSERTCQKLCDVIGPLAYSSLGEINCSTPATTLYLK
jgi:subtilisin family serine protease